MDERQSFFLGILTFEEAADAFEPGEEDAFGDVGLVELVADFPFEFGGDDDFLPEVGMLGEPVVKFHADIGIDGEEGILVHDTFVHGRGFEEEGEGLHGVKFADGGDGVFDHIDSEHVGSFGIEHVEEFIGEELMDFAEVDAPDGAIFVIELDVGGGEVHGDERGVGPI